MDGAVTGPAYTNQNVSLNALYKSHEDTHTLLEQRSNRRIHRGLLSEKRKTRRGRRSTRLRFSRLLRPVLFAHFIVQGCKSIKDKGNSCYYFIPANCEVWP